jgi:hypothetical protein
MERAIKKPQTFEQGDVVKWTSSAGGNSTTKIGKVLLEIPSGEDPLTYARSNIGEYSLKSFNMATFGYGYAKLNNARYLIAVPTTKEAKPKLYMPYTSKLKKASAAEKAKVEKLFK